MELVIGVVGMAVVFVDFRLFCSIRVAGDSDELDDEDDDAAGICCP